MTKKLSLIAFAALGLSSAAHADYNAKPDAYRLCSQQLPQYRLSCQRAVEGAFYLDLEAVNLCSRRAPGYEFSNCLTAITDRAYTSYEVQNCSIDPRLSVVLNCLLTSGRPALIQPPAPPSDPQDRQALMQIRAEVTVAIRYLRSGNLNAALTTLENLAAYVDGLLNNYPGPGPHPGPGPGPHPGPGPTPPHYSCANDDFTRMTQAFAIIKNLAYSSEGFNDTQSGADAYTREWVKRYPCQSAQGFAREAIKVRAFAYATRGLNMTTGNAIAYARENIEKRCYANVEYQTEGAAFYDFAYNQLNYTSANAEAYTRQQMDQKYFTCSGVIDR